MLAELMAELEALRAENQNVKRENMTLKVQVGGETNASEDDALLEAYLTNLRAVLKMRSEGKFDQGTFDTYNASMAQLSDEHVREMYQCFMLVYVDEATEETYARLGLDEEEVDETTVGFCEMMSIKLGELMDQPRHVRVQVRHHARTPTTPLPLPMSMSMSMSMR